MNNDIISGLQNLLADTYLLYIKTQGFHWNVTGPTFGSLHTLFQTQYEELALANDLIAERIKALGGYALGSCSEFIENSNILGARAMDHHTMIDALYNDHTKIAQESRKFIAKLRELDDPITEQLVADRALAHEKTAWMLKAHLED